MEQFSYDSIDTIGRELFRKNNSNFIASKLSPIMAKIFISANRTMNISDVSIETYMKSSAIPDRVYYIYTDQVNDEKMFDIVNFKDKPCIWFYSKNAINSIGKDLENISTIYNLVISMFRPDITNIVYNDQFIDKEYYIIKIVMCTRLFLFLHTTYGISSMEEYKSWLKEELKYQVYPSNPTDDSINKFINHIEDSYYLENYYKDKIYLDSFNKLVFEKQETVDE